MVLLLRSKWFSKLYIRLKFDQIKIQKIRRKCGKFIYRGSTVFKISGISVNSNTNLKILTKKHV